MTLPKDVKMQSTITTGERVISLNKDVLRQVLKDGKTYPTLAKQMAEVILEQMVNDGLPDHVEIFPYGHTDDMEDKAEQNEARKVVEALAKQGLDIAVYSTSSKTRVVGGETMYTTILKRWNFGE